MFEFTAHIFGCQPCPAIQGFACICWSWASPWNPWHSLSLFAAWDDVGVLRSCADVPEELADLIRRYCRYCWCQRAHGVWWGYWQAMLRRSMQPLLRPWFDDRFYCFAADADCIAATVQILESISLLAPRSCFFAVWTDFTTGEFQLYNWNSEIIKIIRISSKSCQELLEKRTIIWMLLIHLVLRSRFQFLDSNHQLRWNASWEGWL